MAEQQATAGTVDVRFHRVSKRFGEVAAVEAVSFEIPRGSFHSFLGPSGCGKTTTLRLIAGFEQPDQGEVAIAGQPMVGIWDASGYLVSVLLAVVGIGLGAWGMSRRDVNG